jgi:hypothetical protein
VQANGHDISASSNRFVAENTVEMANKRGAIPFLDVGTGIRSGRGPVVHKHFQDIEKSGVFYKTSLTQPLLVCITATGLSLISNEPTATSANCGLTRIPDEK